ncbi:hypothetical protein BKA70DRAFT_322486 [Coprinopsis sp. MPI-PUGE-AT-0042]|nr:hypothetical protein BKA70DRAFT_322486 [Coprinopsis sp. MPI-PUGE-AT-0042]
MVSCGLQSGSTSGRSSKQIQRRVATALAAWTSALLASTPLGLFHVLPPADAHVAAWHKGSYCLNGTTPGVNNQNANEIVNPLYKLRRNDWWMHHVNRCDEFPPAPGDFLEIPAGGSFVVELALNRAFTTLSYNGQHVNRYGDGEPHPGLGVTNDGKSSDGCITNPNIHTKNEEGAAGTVFAISYNSNIKDVKPENLVVFTALYNTPWRRIAEYRVPQLPACPPGGCHCVWGWVPEGCGEPNMYMQPLKCKVVGRTGSRAVAPAVPPRWCEGNSSACVMGSKQMIFWNQLEGNNITPPPGRTPTYGKRLGFNNGAQSDIFGRLGSATPTYIAPGPSTTPRDTPGSGVGTPANPLGKITLRPEGHSPVSGSAADQTGEGSDNLSTEDGSSADGGSVMGRPLIVCTLVSALVAVLA